MEQEIKEERRNDILYALCLIISIVLLVVTIVVFCVTATQRRNYLIDNPPTYSFVEEDLEADLCTLDVRVLERETYREVVVYKVWANNTVWKVVYVARYIEGKYWEKREVTFVGYMSEEEVNKILHGTAVEIAKTV